MKIYICGYARHGKDTVADILSNWYGLRHESSSHIAMREFLRNTLACQYGLRYASEEHCYEDRVNHRALWFNIIKRYGEGDPARLSRLIFRDNDLYVGIRNVEEFYASMMERLVDLSIWVDASERLGKTEGKDSNNLNPDDCDIVIRNNGTRKELEQKLSRVFEPMFRKA